jgi:hypothetical protein
MTRKFSVRTGSYCCERRLPTRSKGTPITHPEDTFMTETTAGPSFTGPDTAALHAMEHGGFTTAAHEAFRILEDGRRLLESRAHAARRGEAVEALDTSTKSWEVVRATLTWVAERSKDPQVQLEAKRWVSNETDRYVALNTLTRATTGKYLNESQ